ncbi:MAG TPA: hypothetical protein VFE88_00540 [Candidatus Nanoarchaeia archaeon]|nr:hypothetical protein [Candidatus Nanoarchaeia archaeon]
MADYSLYKPLNNTVQGYAANTQHGQHQNAISYTTSASQQPRIVGSRCPTEGKCRVCTRLCMME